MQLKLNLFLICLSILSAVSAQTNIVQDLESIVPGEGTVKIESDAKITSLLGTPSHNMNLDENTFVKVNGFRIQIFMSSNTKTAKGEAAQRESQIKNSFPELATYVVYVTPNWKLLVGDFITKEEVGIFKRKIQKAFPEFGKEMYTISDKVNIPIQKSY